jgi:hypothetical protein
VNGFFSGDLEARAKYNLKGLYRAIVEPRPGDTPGPRLPRVLRLVKCQGRMKILAAITKPEAIRKILDHLGIRSEAPRRTAARPPPQAELSGTADLAEVDYADPPSPEW